MNILLLSDIHGNYPALKATVDFFQNRHFDLICNCGDSLVYAPFPNETLHWLKYHNTVSILGNTDRKVKRLLKGKDFKKPRKAEKRIMYTSTAEQLDPGAKEYLFSLKKSHRFSIGNKTICLFHGSPEDPDEFLFPNTAHQRFRELSQISPCSIIVTGHSHTPFHITVGDVHFINPGSVGRMFDGNPEASCAVLKLSSSRVTVTHHRISYPVEETVRMLNSCNMPPIYERMYLLGKKLN